MRLALVIVFAKDIGRMADFYMNGLGLPIVDGAAAEGWVRLDAGGCLLALHAIPAAIAARIQISDPPEQRGDTPIKLAFHVDDVDAARSALAARGAAMNDVRRLSGFAFCDGVDPEGNVFQLTTR